MRKPLRGRDRPLRRRGARLRRARGEREGEGAHALLAAGSSRCPTCTTRTRWRCAADGHEAPAEPGYITGWKEMALVDSKDPKAKPLPIAKMMVHHFLYFAPGTVSPAPGSCWGSSGFIGGRGEEHPLGRTATRDPGSEPRQVRDREPHAPTARRPTGG